MVWYGAMHRGTQRKQQFHAWYFEQPTGYCSGVEQETPQAASCTILVSRVGARKGVKTGNEKQMGDAVAKWPETAVGQIYGQ